MIKRILYFVKKNKAGFTVFELLVSISIMTLMTTMVMANYKSSGKKAELEMATQKIVTDLRRVQEFAISLKEFNGSVPSGAWGMRISSDASDNDEYIIFADNDANSANPNVAKRDNNGSEDFETIKFPQGITIKDLDIDGNTGRDYGYITFVAPKPEIYISGANNENNANLPIKDASEIKITLQNSDGLEKNIIVNFFGLIDIAD